MQEELQRILHISKHAGGAESLEARLGIMRAQYCAESGTTDCGGIQ